MEEIKMLKLKKVATLICLLLTATLLLVACASPTTTQPQTPSDDASETTQDDNANQEEPATPPEDPGEIVTLDFWTWRVEDVEFYNRMIDIFESRNPNIRVNQNAIRSTDYNTMLTAALAGGGGPDVFMSRPYGGIAVFAESGFMMPLDDLLPEELATFDQQSLNAAIAAATGNIYGVPAVSQAVFIFYNTDIYEELGLSIPTTWEEFLSNLRATQDAGYVGIANGTLEGWIGELMLGAIGPTFYGANDFFDRIMSGETTFEDPAFIAAVDRLNELAPYMPNQFEGVAYTDMQISFANGISAHFIGGSFEAGTFADLNPDINFNIFATPGDSASDPAYVSSWADMNFSINANTSQLDASLELLRFFASQEFGQAVVDQLAMITSVPGVDVAANPFIARVIELQENSTPYLLLVGFRFEQPTGSSLFQAAVQAMMVGDMTAAEVAAEVQRGVAEWFEPFQ